MICYKDMTFCTFYKDCVKKGGCPRLLTPEVIALAEKWWGNSKAGFSVPICQFVKKPDCWEGVK